MGSAVKTLQIVGYKNSGKTTLISRWIRLLKANGYSVAVLKHHGHGGAPELPDANVDTMRFLEEGAAATVVAGGGMVQFVQHEEPSFEELKKLASFGRPDVLLIEGYKQQPEEKVVLLRDAKDWETLRQLQKIALVVGSAVNASAPCIASREQAEQLDAWLLDWLEKRDILETF